MPRPVLIIPFLANFGSSINLSDLFLVLLDRLIIGKCDSGKLAVSVWFLRCLRISDDDDLGLRHPAATRLRVIRDVSVFRRRTAASRLRVIRGIPVGYR